MANQLELLSVLQTELDKYAIHNIISNYMDSNATSIKYTGGNKIDIGILETTGLGDYDRANGKYPDGNIKFETKQFTLTQDRGFRLRFDRFDVDETNFFVTAARVLKQSIEQNVSPELDSYRFAKLYNNLSSEHGSQISTTALNADNIIDEIIKATVNLMNLSYVTDTRSLICIVSGTVYGLLKAMVYKSGRIQLDKRTSNNITTEVLTVDGMEIRPIPDGLFMTKYVLHDGTSQHGFEPDASAKQINFVIQLKNTPYGIVKSNINKVVTPDQNQIGDDWLVFFRIYHEAIYTPFCLKNTLINAKA